MTPAEQRPGDGLVLGDIAREQRAVHRDTTSDEVDRAFRNHIALHTVIIDLGDGAIGAVGRASFYMQLAGPAGFGYALHAHRPVRRLIDRHRAILDASTPLVDAALGLLAQGGSGRDEELVVRWAEGRYGTVEIGELYRRFALVLENRFRAVAGEHPLLDAVVRHAQDAIGVVSGDGAIRVANPAMGVVLGEAGDYLHTRVRGDDVAALAEAVERASGAPGRPMRIAVRSDSAGRTHDLQLTLTDLRSDRDIGGIVVNATDVTDLKAMQDRLLYEATHDSLTGLPNRAMFRRAYETALTKRADGVALLYIDVDRFKSVNDGLGHRAGDQLLIGVARRLLATTRSDELLARLGGDEFVLLVHDVADELQAVAIAERMLEVFAQPVPVAHTELNVRASIGVVFDNGSLDSDDLLRDADIAMYEAKLRGGGQWAVFDENARLARARRATLERRLARAIARDEIEVAYQPIVDLSASRIIGVEALARWRTTEGSVPPSEFIPIAEDSGLIHALSRRVFERACVDVQSCSTTVPLELSVNLSGRQLARPDLARELVALVERKGFDPRRIVLELTESSLLLDPDAALAVLESLRRVGFRLALDDFGTGHSSLAHLQRYPFDRLKIDRMFVEPLGVANGVSIAASVIALGDSLGFEVVAEGIETPEQLRKLSDLGCPLGQGWVFAPALPPAQLREIVRATSDDRQVADALAMARNAVGSAL